MENKNLYKRKFKFLSTTVLFSVIAMSSYGVTNLQVTPVEIFFNYEAGNTNDALTISDDGTPIVNISEWDDYNFEKHKFAYIKGQSIRNIKVRFGSNYSGLMHLIIKLSYVAGHTDGIGTICNLFIPNFDIDTDDSQILNLTGDFPASVGVHEFQWRWEIYAIPVNNSNYCAAWKSTYTSHHFYTLLATPQAPMAQPWERVLEKACVWASGQNNMENVASAITSSLYSSGFVYETDAGAPRYGGWTYFNLPLFLSEIGTSNEVNCLDMGKAVTTLGNAVGCALYLTTFTGGFALNCILPIGTSSPTNNTFYTPLIADDCREGGFSYHAFSQNSNKYTWDACLKYDVDSDPDNVVGSNPGCGSNTYSYSMFLPCNESEQTYIQRLLDDWTSRESCSNRYNCGYFTYQRIFSVN